MQSAQGMPQTDPLAQLKDIHVPNNVNLWPLDWGWWCLLILCLSGLICLVIHLIRKHKFNKPRRDAQKLLSTISTADENWPMQINTVLKRTAVTYFDPQDVAGLYGNNWHEFLLNSLPEKHKQNVSTSLSTLHSQQYAPKCDNKQFNECIRAAHTWLKHVKIPHAAKSRGQKSSLGQQDQEATHA